MRSPRMLSFVALLVVAAFAARAPAQGGLTQIGSSGISTYIYFRSVTAPPAPSKHSRFLINGAGNVAYAAFPSLTAYPSGQSLYPLGRQLFIESHLDPTLAGTIPTLGKDKIALRFAAERNAEVQIALTMFNGPREYLDQPDARWSSNKLDSFFAFQAYLLAPNPQTIPFPTPPFHKVYRYNGSLGDVFNPRFQPFVPNDPRLKVMALLPANSTINDWNAAGTKIMFSTPAPFGVNTWTWDTTARPTFETALINDPAVSGFSLSNPVFSPNNSNICFSIATTPGGARGIARVDITNPTQSFTWLVLEGGVGVNRISDFTRPQVSPTGSDLAFTFLRQMRINNVLGPVITIGKISVGGGFLAPVFTIGPGGVNNYEVTNWTYAP